MVGVIQIRKHFPEVGFGSEFGLEPVIPIRFAGIQELNNMRMSEAL
jgi:hypothetical protein